MGERGNILIRPETPADYYGVASVHADAFSDGKALEEAVLTALLRQEKQYSPELSLVAETNGIIIGHIIVTPYMFSVYGEEVYGGILAPVGVKKDWQRIGAGTKLMNAVHKSAENNGLEFIILLGHETYYPRFGYETNMFGESSISVDLSRINSENHDTLQVGKMNTKYLKDVQTLWETGNTKVPLAVKPSNDLMSWKSTNKDMESVVFLCDGKAAGYARFSVSEKRVTTFLADHKSTAVKMLYSLKNALPAEDTLTLPLHPLRAEWFKNSGVTINHETWGAGMLCPLTDNEYIRRYIKEVKKDYRNSGIIIWPVPFEAI